MGRFLQRNLVLKGGELEPARMGRLHSTQELWGGGWGLRMKMEALGTNSTLFSFLSWGLFVQLSLALSSQFCLGLSSSRFPFASLMADQLTVCAQTSPSWCNIAIRRWPSRGA